MQPTKREARLAGLLYLVVALAGPFVLLYVPGKLYVPGDAAATAARILAHEPLFRAQIVIGLVSQVCFVAAILALYRMLRGVSGQLATLMAAAILIEVPLGIVHLANQSATLAILRGGEFLAVFETPQREALAMLLLYFDRQGVYVSELFWGLWLLPLGLLIWRSRFLPRWLGVWLFANGLAYVTVSATGLLAPHHAKAAMTYATPLLFGELALVLWLLIAGVRETPATAAPPAPA